VDYYALKLLTLAFIGSEQDAHKSSER